MPDHLAHQITDKNLVNIYETILLDISYAAVYNHVNPDFMATSDGQQSHQTCLILVAGRNEQTVKTILDLTVDRRADDRFQSLLDEAFADKCRDKRSHRVADNEWRGFAVFRPTQTDGTGFEQISRHICPPVGPTKPSVWFLYTGTRKDIAQSVPSMMTIPAFRRSIRLSAKILASININLIECLTETLDIQHPSTGHTFHRLMIANVAHHMAFTDALRAAGIAPDGYVGSSVSELMCAYLDGLIDRRQCLLMAAAIRVPLSNHGQLMLLRTNCPWSELQYRCARRSNIAPCYHFNPKQSVVMGDETAVRAMFAELRKSGMGADQPYPVRLPLHTDGVFVPNLYEIFVEQLSKVLPGRVNTQPSARWLSTSASQSDYMSGAITFSAAESFANTLSSPLLVKEAVDRIPTDVLVINIAATSRLRDVVLTGRPQERYVRVERTLSDQGYGTAIGIDHFLTEIGLVFTAGHWPSIQDL